MSLLSFRRVSKTYGKGETQVNALVDVDLAIEEGSFIAIAGPSGSGKTSLLSLAAGLDSPTQGSVWWKNQELGKLSPAALARHRCQSIGFIYQAYNLFPALTVLENTEYVCLLQNQSASSARSKALAALESVGLKNKAPQFPSSLSGGEQQRVAVARALAAEPSLILADEPTANLDSKTTVQLIELFRTLNRKRNVAFLFSTHDPLVLERVDRIVKIRDGRIES